VSTDNTLVAFGVIPYQEKGITLKVKNLSTVRNYYPGCYRKNHWREPFWANDNKPFSYTKKDPVTLRSDRCTKHVLGNFPVLMMWWFFMKRLKTFNTFVYKTSKKNTLLLVHQAPYFRNNQFIKSLIRQRAIFRCFHLRERGFRVIL